MDRKILFFDIDGTLVGKSMALTAKNIEAVQMAKKNNYLIYICTGRAMTSVYPSIKNFGFDGYITSAGAVIYAEEKMIYEHYIDSRMVLFCIYLFASQGISFTLAGKQTLYQTKGVQKFFDSIHANSANQELKRMRETRQKKSDCLDFSSYHFDIPIAKISFVCQNKQKFEEIRTYFEDYFNIVIFSEADKPYCNGELINKCCTKGDALKLVCDYYHTPVANSIAFGDSMNDYEMLQTAGTAVVSKAASDKLKHFGSYFFENPDEDGIYHVMKEMALI